MDVARTLARKWKTTTGFSPLPRVDERRSGKGSSRQSPPQFVVRAVSLNRRHAIHGRPNVSSSQAAGSGNIASSDDRCCAHLRRASILTVRWRLRDDRRITRPAAAAYLPDTSDLRRGILYGVTGCASSSCEMEVWPRCSTLGRCGYGCLVSAPLERRSTAAAPSDRQAVQVATILLCCHAAAAIVLLALGL